MKKPEVSPEALTTLRHPRAAALLSTLILFSIKSAKEKDQIFFREIPLLSTYCEYFNYILYCPFCWAQAGFG